MTAIVTKNQRINNAKSFLEKYTDSPVQDSLYLWIAKSDFWSDDINATADNIIETPIGDETDKSAIYNEMIGMKKIDPTGFSHTVPTIGWTFGSFYDAWDDKYSETSVVDGIPTYLTIYDKNFYVITSGLKVYKCILTGSGISTEEPSHVGEEPLKYSDGYVWHFMYEVSANDALTFYNSSYFPVADKSSQDPDQENIEGGIFRIVVTDGGSGYLTAPNVTIEGNGTGAEATAILSGNTVSEIVIDETDSIIEAGKKGLKHGVGYDYAKVIIDEPASGTKAIARAVLSPKNGHGYDPISELGAYNIQVAVDLETDEEGDLMISNDYRKFGLIENPHDSSSPSTPASANTLNCLKSLIVLGGTFSPDDVIEDTTTQAQAFVDWYDSGNNLVYYHQNDKTGYKNFGVGNTIQCVETTESGTINAINDSEYTPFTGEILFIENRSAIIRSSATREEIRLIVQF